jgi:hypothetical protein
MGISLGEKESQQTPWLAIAHGGSPTINVVPTYSCEEPMASRLDVRRLVRSIRSLGAMCIIGIGLLPVFHIGTRDACGPHEGCGGKGRSEVT